MGGVGNLISRRRASHITMIVSVAALTYAGVTYNTDTTPTERVYLVTFEGETLTDSSGSGNDIDTNTSGTFVTGYSSTHAISLAGGSAGGAGNAYTQQTPGVFERVSSDGWSMAANIKVSNTALPKYVICQGTNETACMKYLNTGGGVDRSILCAFKDSSNLTRQALAVGPDELIATDTWAHVACVFNKDTDTLTAYVNGVAGTPTATSTSFDYLYDDPAAAGGGVSLGCLASPQNCTGVQAFTAITIDNPMMWNRPLTAAEVTQLAAM